MPCDLGIVTKKLKQVMTKMMIEMMVAAGLFTVSSVNAQKPGVEKPKKVVKTDRKKALAKTSGKKDATVKQPVKASDAKK